MPVITICCFFCSPFNLKHPKVSIFFLTFHLFPFYFLYFTISAFFEGPPTLPLGSMSLHDGAGSGPDIGLFTDNMDSPSELRSLEKLTPSVMPGTGVARFDHALRFDMGDAKGRSSKRGHT